MKHSFWLAAVAYVVLCGSAPPPATVEDRVTEEGVRAVEVHWQNAFTHGDGAYLEKLLTEDYVSVSGKGVARDRKTIVQLAESYAKKNPTAEMVTALSPGTEVKVNGTTAIVTSLGVMTTPSGPLHSRSVDVFFYANGRWHAWYSQHTDVAG
jgi:Domain of unknown function (DUF4440)